MRLNSFILSLLLFIVVRNSLASQDCVILLHGLGRTSFSMSSIASYLKKSNYIVINQHYPTTKKSVRDLADENVDSMVNECQKLKPAKIHFVTHSLGGIVLRTYLLDNKIHNLGRIVMLAPPNHGSQLADIFHHNILYQIFAGPAGQEITTKQPDLVKLNKPVKYQVGVIAGNFNFSPFTRVIFHEDNDGKVAVSSTRLAGMKDFIVLPVSHMFMMRNKLVIKEIGYFLEKGSFDKELVKTS